MFGLDLFNSGGDNPGDFAALIEKYKDDENVQNLISSQEFQEVMSDPEIMKAIKEKNFMKLMMMSKFQEFLKNPDVQKVIKQ